jgi:hypothetical protein
VFMNELGQGHALLFELVQSCVTYASGNF